MRDLLAERGVDVAARSILYRVQQFAPLLARAGRRAVVRPGARWWCDETYVRVGGSWAYRYRAIDGHGQVVDVLLRAHRDLDSARAFFDEVPGATHRHSGLHRKRGPDTKPIARSHVPTKDRPRPMRGPPSIRTGQRTVEGVEPEATVDHDAGPHTRAGAAVMTFTWPAHGLRVAA